MIFKKIIVFILLFMFIVPVVGCGNNNKDPDEGTYPPSPQTPVDPNANFGDPVVPEKEIVSLGVLDVMASNALIEEGAYSLTDAYYAKVPYLVKRGVVKEGDEGYKEHIDESKMNATYQAKKLTFSENSSEIKIFVDGAEENEDVLVTMCVYTENFSIRFSANENEVVADTLLPNSWNKLTYISKVQKGSGNNLYVSFMIDKIYGSAVYVKDVAVKTYIVEKNLLGGAILYQLPSQEKINSTEYNQNESYVLLTPDKKIIVMDGGNAGDGEYLYNFIKCLGNEVEAWFISHPHSDHYMALTNLLQNYELNIKKLYYDFGDMNWIINNSPGSMPLIQEFEKQVKLHGIPVQKPVKDDVYEFGSVKVKVLNNAEHYSYYGGIGGMNSLSIIYKVYTANASILFLGDADIDEGAWLLENVSEEDLKSTIVQMAHHGQNGVDEALYKVISPKICLWPNVDWVWHNRYDTNIYSTYYTRHWMQELGVVKNYLAKDGLCVIK